MKNISKEAEPESLNRHRCNTNSDYDNYPKKDNLRESLVGEQRGICCYCTQRIRPSADGMKIEHWQCQSRFPEKQLDYSNLLGACLGCQGQALERQHCDTRKGDLDLTYNPANPNHDVESKLAFLGDGTIQSTDTAFDSEINEILNLNERILVKNRKATLEPIESGFMTKKLSKADIQKELRKWNGESDDKDLEPFCQVVVYYLRKKLRKMT
jgi:uncharacterized protein (TIGR02646 family)